MNKEFNLTAYAVVNNIDYLIEFSRDKASARIQLENKLISEWVKIEHVSLACSLDNPSCYGNTCNCDNTPVINVNDLEVYLSEVIELKSTTSAKNKIKLTYKDRFNKYREVMLHLSELRLKHIKEHASFKFDGITYSITNVGKKQWNIDTAYTFYPTNFTSLKEIKQTIDLIINPY